MKSWIEISTERLRENFRAVQSVAGPGAEVLAVIKADGYGHGATLCAPLLRDAGATWLGVTDVEEGAAVRSALGENTTRILVMCGMEQQDAALLVQHALTPVVWTPEHLHALDAAAQAADTRLRVHVEVDTGMSRQGVALGDDLRALLFALNSSSRVRCEGVMTHLCCAEVSGAATTRAAEERFVEASGQFSDAHIVPEFFHIANTSAVDEGSVTAWLRNLTDSGAGIMMVRTGLALFGYALPLEGEHQQPSLQNKLQPVMTWKAPVTGLRTIAAGASVGYGATFIAPHSMRLALLPVGYADGFRREASSGIGDGWVMFGQQKAPVVGRVSMNLTVVDVTEVPAIHFGSEAILLGEGVTAEDHAAWAGTIPYDILCGVRGRRRLA